MAGTRSQSVPESRTRCPRRRRRGGHVSSSARQRERSHVRSTTREHTAGARARSSSLGLQRRTACSWRSLGIVLGWPEAVFPSWGPMAAWGECCQCAAPSTSVGSGWCFFGVLAAGSSRLRGAVRGTGYPRHCRIRCIRARDNQSGRADFANSRGDMPNRAAKTREKWRGSRNPTSLATSPIRNVLLRSISDALRKRCSRSHP